MKRDKIKRVIKNWGIFILIALLIFISGLFIVDTLKIREVQEYSNTAYTKMTTIEEYIQRVNSDDNPNNNVPLNGYYQVSETVEIDNELIDGFNVYLIDGKVVSGILRFNNRSIVISKGSVTQVTSSDLVLSLIGSEELEHNYKEPYIDPMATAIDLNDGDISSKVIVSGIVDVNKLGRYLLKYSVTNSNNKTVTKSRVVNVVDKTKPVITLNGNEQVIHTASNVYNDLKATASDNYDGDISNKIIINNNVQSNNPGTYQITYFVIDKSGNSSDVLTRTVIVYNYSEPFITIKGSSLIQHPVGTIYKDLGASSYDINDGQLPVTSTGKVNYNKVGSYKIVYTSVNSQNIISAKTRIVNVVDKIKPIISINGNEELFYELNSSYLEQGAIAIDNYDGDITDKIVITSNINTKSVGKYTVKYDVVDNQGNIANTVNRYVYIIDTDKPIINLIGKSSVLHEAKTDYVDEGATASDSYDGNISSKIITTNNINKDLIGTYEIKYDVEDSSGNKANTVTREVKVVDTTKPTLSIIGDNITIEVGSSYTDQGATAIDSYDGDITDNIVTTSTVNTKIVGKYTITYDAEDANGNKSTISRTVDVVDTTKPILNLIGNSKITHEAKTEYIDLGATAMDNYDGDITSSVVVEGIVNTDLIGNYILIYKATDANGNEADPILRIIEVKDTTKPVITLIGSSSITHLNGTIYNDLGATAIDNYDGNLTSLIDTTGTVDYNVDGLYTITYNVKDASGNEAIPVTRSIKVSTEVIYNFNYTGSAQSFTATYSGRYILEVWGAQGGNDIYYPTTNIGGTGGYTKGELTLTANANLYVYVGGQGTGCMNSNWGSSGGGGATDIRLVSGDWNNEQGLYSRIIVAGGGGGRHGNNYELVKVLGNYGGGLTSPTFTVHGFTITGASQTDGGASNYHDPDSIRPGAFGYAIANIRGNSCSKGGYNGGGDGSDNWANGGAGGGWYGGCTSWPASSGGSSYVLTSTSVKPIGYTPTETYYMTNTQVLVGNETMPNPSGGTQIGQTGNGFARITYIGK